MDNGIYAALTRQSGLMREMRVVANNIANANTTGFRREGVIFSEHLTPLDRRGDTLSMANARGRMVDLHQAVLNQTNGTFDVAIEGEGFFMISTPEGNRLTRAGAFMPSAEGELMNADGHRLLDDGGAPIIVPAGMGQIAIGPDGTLSAAGQPIARIGVFAQPPGEDLLHDGGTTFQFSAEPEPMEDARVRQGFLEDSNVDPVFEISRMIEVQRAYEMGQTFLDREDQRIRSIVSSINR